MKTQILFTFLSLFTSAISFASTNFRELNQTVTEINTLEQQNDYKLAALTAATTAMRVTDEAGAETVVATIFSSLNEIRQETVVESHNTGLGFSFLFGLFSGEGSQSYNVTKIITTNPSEVAAFPSKVGRDFRSLQSQLRDYVKKNEMALFYAKILTAKAAELTQKLNINELSEVAPTLEKAIQMVSRMQFQGNQVVSRCLTTHYIGKTNSEGLNISGLLFSFSFENKVVTSAHNDQSCAEEIQKASVDESKIVSGRLAHADMILAKYSNIMGLRLATDLQSPFYPTWGSLYYK